MIKLLKRWAINSGGLLLVLSLMGAAAYCFVQALVWARESNLGPEYFFGGAVVVLSLVVGFFMALDEI